MLWHFVNVITCTLYFFIGTDRPKFKFLNHYVIHGIAPYWFNIGLHLLDKQYAAKLDEVKANYSQDLGQCAIEMLQLWLQVKVDADWNQLIQTLKQPGIDLIYFASRIENMLLKEEIVSLKGII